MTPTPAVTLRKELPDPEAYYRLFETTGWNEEYAADRLELSEAIGNASYTVSAYAPGNNLVGFGRIITDGVLYAFVCDMIVAPEYRRQGIGSRILEHLKERCRELGIRVIWLFAAEGKAGFYEKHGFLDRPSGAPGMQLKLK